MRTFLLLLYLLTCLAAVPNGLAGSPPQGVAGVKNEVDRSLSRLKTVKLNATVITEPSIDDLKFYQALGTIPGLEGKITVVYSREGYFRIETSLPNEMPDIQKTADPPEDFRSTDNTQFRRKRDAVRLAWQARGLTPPTRIVVNGPKGLFQSWPAIASSPNSTASYEKVVREQVLSGFVPDNPVKDLLVVMGWQAKMRPGAELASDADLTVIDWKAYSISGFELIEDSLCIKIELGDGSELLLDTQRGYVVRKRSWKFRGLVVLKMLADDFSEFGDGVFLPTQLTYTSFGHGDFHGRDLHGKAMYVQKYSDMHWSINQAEHASAFEVNIPAGSLVVDNTILKVKPSSKPFGELAKSNVSYIQPANEEELEAVVQGATDEAKLRNSSVGKSPIVRWALAGTFLVGLIVLAMLYHFFWRDPAHVEQ